MPEVETTTTPPVKLAGKYETPEALAEGFRNIHKAVFDEDIPADEPLIGEGKRFKDAAAAEAEYKRLEKVRGRFAPKGKPPPKAEGVQIDATAPTADELENLQVPDIIAKAGLETADLEEQYAEHKELTPEQYAALRKVNPGLSKSVIKHIAEGLVAKAALNREAQTRIKADAIQVAGGETELNGLLEFAKTLGPERIADLNRRLSSPALYKGALTEIKAEYAGSAQGKSKPLVTGTPGSGGSGAATTKTEFLQLLNAARNGDKGAQARVKATPNERVMSWG